MKKRDECLDRQAATILSKEVFAKFANECTLSNEPKSRVVHAKVVEYYNNKSVQERANLMRLYNEMTEEQKKNPRKP